MATHTRVGLITGPGPIVAGTVQDDDGDGTLTVRIDVTGGYPQLTVGQVITCTPGDIFPLTEHDLHALDLTPAG